MSYQICVNRRGHRTTDQEEEAGAGQPKVSSSMTVNVEVFGRQVTVRVQDLKCSLEYSVNIIACTNLVFHKGTAEPPGGFLITPTSLLV